MVPLGKNAMSQGLSNLLRTTECDRLGAAPEAAEDESPGPVAQAAKASGRAAMSNLFMWRLLWLNKMFNFYKIEQFDIK
jgi:hypothetical protein